MAPSRIGVRRTKRSPSSTRSRPGGSGLALAELASAELARRPAAPAGACARTVTTHPAAIRHIPAASR